MKTAYQGALFVGFLVLSNVVAAGVFAVLGPIAVELADETASIAAMAVVGILSVCCALIFLRGAVFYAVELAGLQSAAGQRGG